MKKYLKVLFIISIILNFALVAALVSGNYYVEKQFFKMAAINAYTEVMIRGNILEQLESDDLHKIDEMKSSLRQTIGMCYKTAENLG